MNGRTLTFRLAGINNQNFVMRDDQTGSWWQQVSGLAIAGPLRGQRLTLVPHDELTFATWKAEQPHGRVLNQDADALKRDDYAEPDWEEHVGRYPVHVAVAPGGPLEPRTTVVGVTRGGKSKAWPQASVMSAGATIDQVGDVPLALVVAPDGRSIRVFDRRVNGQTLTFVRAGTAITTSALLDLETMSEWDFEGRATGRRPCGRATEDRGLPARLLVRLEDVPPGHGRGEAVGAARQEATDAGDPASRRHASAKEVGHGRVHGSTGSWAHRRTGAQAHGNDRHGAGWIQRTGPQSVAGSPQARSP